MLCTLFTRVLTFHLIILVEQCLIERVAYNVYGLTDYFQYSINVMRAVLQYECFSTET